MPGNRYNGRKTVAVVVDSLYMTRYICFVACQFRHAADTRKTTSKHTSMMAHADRPAAVQSEKKQQRESRRRVVDGRNKHSSVQLRDSKSAQTVAHVCTEPCHLVTSSIVSLKRGSQAF